MIIGLALIYWEVYRQNWIYKEQEENLTDYFFITSVTCKRDEQNSIEYVRFWIDFFNASAFEIIIEDKIKGHIFFRNKDCPLNRENPFRLAKDFTLLPKSFEPVKPGRFVIAQELNNEDIKLIEDSGKFEENDFIVSGLIFSVGIKDNSLQNKPKEFKIPDNLLVTKFTG